MFQGSRVKDILSLSPVILADAPHQLCFLPEQGATLRHRQRWRKAQTLLGYAPPWFGPFCWRSENIFQTDDMLTESFHGSPSAQRDLSVSVGTRGPYSRDLWSTYMIPFCRKEMCASLRNKVITFILRLCPFPIRGVRAQTYLPPLCCLSPAHSLSLFTIVEAIPGGRWKERVLTSGLLTAQPQKAMPGR